MVRFGSRKISETPSPDGVDHVVFEPRQHPLVDHENLPHIFPLGEIHGVVILLDERPAFAAARRLVVAGPRYVRRVELHRDSAQGPTHKLLPELLPRLLADDVPGHGCPPHQNFYVPPLGSSVWSASASVSVEVRESSAVLGSTARRTPSIKLSTA